MGKKKEGSDNPLLKKLKGEANVRLRARSPIKYQGCFLGPERETFLPELRVAVFWDVV